MKSTDPALADEEPADRTVHWWRRTWPGHSRPGYPPVALVVTDAGPVALANRQRAVADLAREDWGGSWWTIRAHDAGGDGWREYDDAVPVIATTLDLLAEHGPMGPVWWRYGRDGARYCLLEALESPDTRQAYDERQDAREEKARQVHRELMRTLACADCGRVPKEESTWEYGPEGQMEWTRRPGGRCWDCHEKEQQRREEEREAGALARLEAARAANARLRPCWTCGSSIGGKSGSVLELTEKAGPDRLECPQCDSDREEKELGPLVLPAPTRRELLAARFSAPADPWWQERLLHAELYPVRDGISA
ncbi:hypothetical protein [Kitasatospora sp. MY 5-36]|uniref:hypothetical protein n=1 Tax=Kitasatospora sp. MY 5-36 TaxID=1678027 RepID=UPI00131D5707|nr:hypothetical protein [Kitasatospora sp. MY 5-36]